MNLRTPLYFLLPLLMLANFASARKAPRKALEKAYVIKPFDAVIVPGVPYNGQGWDSVMKARVLWSWILYKNGYTKNLIYSGGAVYTPFYEAKIMGLYAKALGIPTIHIFYDTIAKHSTENVYYSYLLAKREGFKSLALGTDPFQSFMLHGFTSRRFGTPIYHLPFIVDSLKLYNCLSPRIDPGSAGVYYWESIKENQSMLKRIKGTLGRSICWKQYKGGKVEPL